MRFASFFSGGFTTMAVMNPPEKELGKHTSVHWGTAKVHDTWLVFSRSQVDFRKKNMIDVGPLFI